MAQKHINPIQNREQVIRCAEDNFTDLYGNKQDKLSAQTAYSAKGSSTKVPQITTNTLGQVTNITEVDVTDTGATSVTVTGSGQAVDSASYDASTRKLTLTKGISVYNKTEVDNKIASITNNTSADVSYSDLSNVTGKENGGSLAVVNSQAVVNSIKGNTYVYNQLIQNGNFTSSSYWNAYNSTNISLSISGNVASCTALTSGSGYNWGLLGNTIKTAIKGHKYLFKCEVYTTTTRNFYFDDFGYGVSVSCTANQWTTVAGIFNNTSTTLSTFIIKPLTALAVGEVYKVKKFVIIDLTQWFGAGNEPSSASEAFLKIPSAMNYLEYNAGTFVHSNNTINSNQNLIDLNTSKMSWGYGTYNYTTTTKGSSQKVVGNVMSATCNQYASMAIIIGDGVHPLTAGTYYVNFDSVSNATVAVYKTYSMANGTYKSGVTSSGASSSFSFTATDTAFYYVSVYGADSGSVSVSITNLQVVGSGSKQESPYATDSIEDIGQLRGYGTGQDTIDLARGKKTTKTVIVHLGDCTWNEDGDYYYYTPNVRFGYTVASATATNAITTLGQTYSSDWSIKDGRVFFLSGAKYLEFYKCSYASTSDFKTAMNGVYLIAEALTYTEEDIVLQKGLASWTGGLQYQSNLNGTIQAPYTINKTYSLNVGQTLINNIQTDLAEEKRLDALENADYLPKSGGTMTGAIIAELPSGTSGEFKATRTVDNVTRSIWVGIGTGNVNRGLYDGKLDKWVVYSDDSSSYFNGNATSATKDSSGNTITSTYLKLSGGTITASSGFRPLAIKGNTYGAIIDFYNGSGTLCASSGYYSSADMCYIGPEVSPYAKLGICYSTKLPVYSPNNGTTKYELYHKGNLNFSLSGTTLTITNS